MLTVEERIKRFNSAREPVYTKLKYNLMAKDPFVFFRGTCHLFYEDLHKSGTIPASPDSWICGDLHLENFGSYKGDNRLVYFDLTDFDEGILAPAAWELVRIVTSIFIALDEPPGNQREITKVAKLFLQSYSEVLNKGKARYIEQQTATGITRSFLDKVSQRKQKDLVDKRTSRNQDGSLRLKIDNTKLFAIDENLKKKLGIHLTHWIQSSEALSDRYNVVDAGFRIAGTGSVGLKRYLFLLRKENTDKHLLIDMKQARPSSIQLYAGSTQPAWTSDAERAVNIQGRMQNMSPALLSTTIFDNHSYILKEMQPTEDKIDFMLVRDDSEKINNIIQDLALLTSSAQLRSSGRQGSASADELIAFGGNGDWQKGILDYAFAYTALVRRDYQAYVRAFESGFFS